MDMNFERLPGETDDALIDRICSQKKQIGKWDDVADILNGIFNVRRTESFWRKKWRNQLVPSIKKEKVEPVNKNESKLRELEHAKIKYRDERNAWNKQNYLEARVAENLDILDEKLSKIGNMNFHPVKSTTVTSDNDILVILSDLHIGETFNTPLGKYNTDIAKNRLNQLLSEVLKIKELHNAENCYVSCQGDLISGSIHKSIQITNRENVIEQIKIASELISSFCFELTKNFNNVYMSSVVGNHTRIDRKEDALHDERLDDLIEWAVGGLLSHVENFEILKGHIDSGISAMSIRDKVYLSVHGDYDPFSKQGVSNLCMMLGYLPYAILYGHKHTCAYDEASNIKMIRGGSLSGTGDQYTIEKRLYGKPSQMICVCNTSGVVSFYPTVLL